MRMTIEDNGRGFDPDSSFPGLGLRTMHERAAAAGGSLQIDLAPGAGTRVPPIACCRTAMTSRRDRTGMGRTGGVTRRLCEC